MFLRNQIIISAKLHRFDGRLVGGIGGERDGSRADRRRSASSGIRIAIEDADQPTFFGGLDRERRAQAGAGSRDEHAPPSVSGHVTVTDGQRPR